MCAAGNSGDDPGHCIPSSGLATFMYLAVLPPKAVGGDSYAILSAEYIVAPCKANFWSIFVDS